MSLPILSSLFFEKHTPEVGFFSKWQSLMPWSDHMLPIYEWQEILYVGCSRPPLEFPKVSAKVVYVLCEPEALKQVWYEYQGTVVSNIKKTLPGPPQGIQDMPEGLSMDLDIPAAAPDDSTSLLLVEDSDEHSTEESPNEQDLPEANESLELLTLDPIPGVSNPLSNPLSDKTSLISLKAVTDEEIDFPSVVKIAPLSANDNSHDQSENTDKIEIKQEPVHNPAVSLVKTDLSKKTNPHVTIRSETVTGFTTGERSAAIEQRATPQKSEVLLKSKQSEKEEITKSSITALTQTYSGNLDSEMQAILSEMEATFPKVMILLKNGDQIKPWKWTESFHSSNKGETAYSLQSPSPLRVVYRTHMPYHGYVVSNDFNVKFFKDWNESQIPPHLTVAPILINDHVIGMLLGISEKPKDESMSLLLAEKAAEKLTKQIKTRPKMSKSA